MQTVRSVGATIGVVALLGLVAVLTVAGIAGFLGSWARSEPRDVPEPRPPVESAAPALAPAAAGPSAFRELADADWLARTAEATGIPERALTAYAAADIQARREYGCAVGWNTLAGIGWVESRHGRLQGGVIEEDGVTRPDIVGIALDGTNDTLAIPDTDGGILDGDAEWDRAVGPMQFIPETWRRWAVSAAGEGEPSPQHIDDAALTAARYLCRLDGGLEAEAEWIRAILSYNHSHDYQVQVATAADRYAAEAG